MLESLDQGAQPQNVATSNKRDEGSLKTKAETKKLDL